ncbi:SDR family NAD(P)-dependent oxidoreductase [Streptomyces sp. NBC_00868]|uniref:type I polyketide synthase n=1 Tax=unclassified Streptomyces TaxID=2593676 RepID=UPI00324717FA|nr:SDR family NAD(P)-dependent oxidoreductase [Streptomyces sp. NBC_00868]
MSSITARIAALPAAQRALLEERLRQRRESPGPEPIAVVGMGCRFPGGVGGPEAFWTLLRSGADATSTVPEGRWDAERLHDPEGTRPGTVRTTRGGFLDDIDTFDAEFFGISPREAETLDPQHRLLLEVAWDALEHAGQAPGALQGTQTGVFVGIGIDDYKSLQTSDLTRIDGHTGTGNLFCAAPGRISYVLGLRGPSLAVDTGCSSSLVTVHLAMQSLRSGECDLALAGGVNVMVSPEMTVFLSQAGVLSPGGRSRAFDASADGYARGEGAGLVVLKRLSDAEAAGDEVLAVLRGSAVNHGGRSSGLTVPNGSAQRELVTRALAVSQVAPADIDYVETHGTGTSLGDPIEANALGSVLREGRAADRPLLMGTVKTNIGHLEAAAGIAGLMKVVLALRAEEIPASLHLHERNPQISWDDLLLDVPVDAAPWRRSGRRRLAGVSSFGVGGTNAHVIVEEAPPRTAPRGGEKDRPVHPVALSAKDEPALRRLVQRYRRHLERHPELSLADVAHSTNTGRTHFGRRLFFVAADTEDLRAQLTAWEERPAPAPAPARTPGSTPRTAFLFTGQGAQHFGMGDGLYATQPVFRQAIDTCAGLLRDRYGWSLVDVLYGEDADRSLIDRTGYAQPALFAVAYALASMWKAWGVTPSAVLGHSVGEIAGACVAGVLRLEDALRLVAERGRLMQELPDGGGMAAVQADEPTVSAMLAPYAGRLSVAAVNSPTQTVVSGSAEALDALIASLRGSGTGARRLNTSHAFHSASMDPVLEPFGDVVAGIPHRPGRTPVISTVTGRQVTGEEMGRHDYWGRNVRRTVRFLPALRALLERRFDAVVEIGPEPVLARLVRKEGLDPQGDRPWLASLSRHRDDWRQVLESLGSLYTAGADIDWHAVDAGFTRNRVALPTYPFARQRYWRDTRQTGGPPQAREAAFPGERLRSPALRDTVYRNRFTSHSPAFLADHVLFGTVVAPGASHLAMALAAATEGREGAGVLLDGVSFPQALALDAEGREVQLVIEGDDETLPRGFRVVSAPAGTAEPHAWTTHATGTVRTVPASGESDTGPEAPTPSELRARGAGQFDGAGLYAAMRDSGADLGPGFRYISEVVGHRAEALVRMDTPAPRDPGGRYVVHPGLVDACVQAVVAMVWSATGEREELGLRVPIRMDQVRFHQAPPAGTLWCHVTERRADSPDDDTVVADLVLRTADHRKVLEIDGLWLRRVPGDALLRPADSGIHQKTTIRQLTWTATGPAPAGGTAPEAEWIVFADRGGVGAALASRLRADGHPVTVVEPDAAAASAGGDGTLALVPEWTHPGRPGKVAFLWGLDEPEGDLTAESLDEVQRTGSAALMTVLQGLAAAGTDATVLVATRGVHRVTQGPVRVAHAPLWGLAAIANAENPEVRSLLVDLDPRAQAPEREAEWLHAEAGRGIGDGEHVSFRDGRRHLARPTPWLPPRGAGRADRPLSPDGTYLVTGGLGALGLHTARWLVERGARNLTLIGRREPSAAARRAIRAWELSGVRVATRSVDVSDRLALQWVLTELDDFMPPLRGVVHAAGVLDDGSLQRQDPGRLRSVMAPKTRGAWNLHVLTQDRDLDFFVLYSSAAALMGSRGQSGYAAANAFLDALAHHRQHNGLPGTSIAWGPWSGEGMVATLDAASKRRLASLGFELLDPEAAFRALADVLRAGAAHAYILAGKHTGGAAGGPRPAQDGSAARQSVYARPAALGAANPPRDDTEAALVAIWESLLGIHPIGVDDNYFELGGDSITSIRITSKAKQAGIRLTEADVFAHPTVAALARTARPMAPPADDGPVRDGRTVAEPADAGFPGVPLAADDLRRLMAKIEATAEKEGGPPEERTDRIGGSTGRRSR